MARSEQESVGTPFGIAHATVVPENFDPERALESGDRTRDRIGTRG
jgi:hypothetical protein